LNRVAIHLFTSPLTLWPTFLFSHQEWETSTNSHFPAKADHLPKPISLIEKNPKKQPESQKWETATGSQFQGHAVVAEAGHTSWEQTLKGNGLKPEQRSWETTHNKTYLEDSKEIASFWSSGGVLKDEMNKLKPHTPASLSKWLQTTSIVALKAEKAKKDELTRVDKWQVSSKVHFPGDSAQHPNVVKQPQAPDWETTHNVKFTSEQEHLAPISVVDLKATKKAPEAPAWETASKNHFAREEHPVAPTTLIQIKEAKGDQVGYSAEVWQSMKKAHYPGEAQLASSHQLKAKEPEPAPYEKTITTFYPPIENKLPPIEHKTNYTTHTASEFGLAPKVKRQGELKDEHFRLEAPKPEVAFGGAKDFKAGALPQSADHFKSPDNPRSRSNSNAATAQWAGPPASPAHAGLGRAESPAPVPRSPSVSRVALLAENPKALLRQETRDFNTQHQDDFGPGSPARLRKKTEIPNSTTAKQPGTVWETAAQTHYPGFAPQPAIKDHTMLPAAKLSQETREFVSTAKEHFASPAQRVPTSPAHSRENSRALSLPRARSVEPMTLPNGASSLRQETRSFETSAKAHFPDPKTVASPSAADRSASVTRDRHDSGAGVPASPSGSRPGSPSRSRDSRSFQTTSAFHFPGFSPAPRDTSQAWSSPPRSAEVRTFSTTNQLLHPPPKPAGDEARN
jgi:hypothetical protein